MNIIQPYARMLSNSNPSATYDALDGKIALRRIEYFGRISHRSEDKQTNDSWERFIKNVVMEHGDWSITEHASVTVDFMVDRGITHEIVRHRLFSYTQESTRFVNYEKKMPPSFINPSHCIGAIPTSAPDALGFTDNPKAMDAWEAAIVQCEESYKTMLAAGCAPQIARSVLPNALASRIAMTGNLRSWRHFLIMRTTREAHPQMRQVTIPLLADFQKFIPLLYDDIEPMAKQSEQMKLAR